MAFVHAQSCECAKSELDLFSVPPTQTSIESGTWVEYHPVSAITGGSPIEFEINGSGEDYVDFANSYLHVKAKITKPDGTALDADTKLGPTNLFLHSLFSQIDIALNGTQITSATNTYPYRAMIETLLSYGQDSKETQLRSALYIKDTAGNMESTDLEGATANAGMVARQAYTSGSKTVEMMGRIHADIFFQERFMLNEMTTKIKLVRSKDIFCLMAADAVTAKLHIVSAALYIRKVKLSPSVFLAHAKALEQSNAKYPIRRVVCKSFTVPIGVSDFSNEKLFSGQLPMRLVIGFVDNGAFNGAKNKNPFNFQHFSVTELAVHMDGQQQQAIKPLRLDYDNNHYISSYLSMFSGTGKINRDDGNFVTRDEYPNGYALYTFDLSPDLAEDDHFNLSREGSVRLVVRFGKALTASLTVIVYGEFENIIEVDRNRNVLFDFAS
jgi:hypothetical protein